VFSARLFNSLILLPCSNRVHRTTIISKALTTHRHSAQRFARTGHHSPPLLANFPQTLYFHLSAPVFHGHPWLSLASARSYGGSSVLPSFWTVCRHFILAYLALIGFIKALRDAPDTRHSHLRSRYHITLLPCSRHLLILSTSFPCPLFLPDSRPLPCRRRNL
jgi:hypothetical protein